MFGTSEAPQSNANAVRTGVCAGTRLAFSAALLLLGAAPALHTTAQATLSTERSEAGITLDHFDHLFAETEIGDERVGVLNIYSVAPDYRFAIEPNEGYACVDDVARGMVLLAAAPGVKSLRLHQLDLMARFVLQMQAENGYFYNFIWADGRINREYRTSRAELNWWSLRALWGLEAALQRLPAGGPTADRARRATDRLVANLKRDLAVDRRALVDADGIAVPNWLPFGSGADATSTALLGLIPHYRRTRDAGTRALIERLGEGLMAMQVGDATTFPYGAHLSWRNQWHGWGNAQAYALLRAGELLGRRDFRASALREIDHFYPYLLEHGMLSSFSLRTVKGHTEAVEIQRFPQIAYGISPMVIAAMEAYRQTGLTRYRDTARRLGSWLSSRNEAGRPMYDPATGRVLDGINAPFSANLDSGAESTVEGLLALRALEGTRLP